MTRNDFHTFIEVCDGVTVCTPTGPCLPSDLFGELPFARSAVLDLSGVTVVNGDGLLALASLARDRRSVGLEFALCGARPAVRRLLAAVGLHATLDVYACREAAVNALASAV